MHQEAKIVPLKHEFAGGGLRPDALQKVHQHCASQLQCSLQQLFSSADDVLFDMAERASTNAEQNSMFEAMRDLRLKRKKLEQAYLASVLSSFHNLGQREIGRKRKAQEHSIESLALVQNDELEESVAVDSMVSKVLSNNANALGLLSARFSQLTERKISDDDNPLGPRQLAGNFLEACTILGFEIQIKLIILKLFEKSVLNPVDQLYDSCNEILIKSGVLPELTSLAAQNKPKRPSVIAQTEEADAPAPASEAQIQIGFAELQGLLSGLRGSQATGQAPDNAVPISSGDLINLLSHLQKHNIAADHSSTMAVRQQLDSILQRASAKSNRVRIVGEIDNDVINLVSLLFDFILDAPAVPSKLKALIGRLQIPLLKVAVIDKSFFSHGNHPARRLLNEIGSAAIGWNDQELEQQDNLYNKIEQVVFRIQQDFVEDTEFFNEILQDFVNFISAERRRSELLEQRIRDAEEGRARSEFARQQVETELNRRLLGQVLPEAVVQILHQHWSKVMLLNHLKHGAESGQWLGSLKTMDQLIWSVLPHDDSDSLDKLTRLVPALLETLRQGLGQAALDPFESKQLFDKLEVLHAQALQRAQDLATPGTQQDSTGADSTQPARKTPEQYVQQNQELITVTDEISLSTPEPALEPDEPDNTRVEPEQKTLDLVDQIRPGCWFELQQEDNRSLRCKLAAVIKATGRYIFVNRRGLKVLEKSRQQFALALQEEKLIILDDSMLFDRALESVIGDLRRLKSGD